MFNNIINGIATFVVETQREARWSIELRSDYGTHKGYMKGNDGVSRQLMITAEGARVPPYTGPTTGQVESSAKLWKITRAKPAIFPGGGLRMTYHIRNDVPPHKCMFVKPPAKRMSGGGSPTKVDENPQIDFFICAVNGAELNMDFRFGGADGPAVQRDIPVLICTVGGGRKSSYLGCRDNGIILTSTPRVWWLRRGQEGQGSQRPSNARARAVFDEIASVAIALFEGNGGITASADKAAYGIDSVSQGLEGIGKVKGTGQTLPTGASSGPESRNSERCTGFLFGSVPALSSAISSYGVE